MRTLLLVVAHRESSAIRLLFIAFGVCLVQELFSGCYQPCCQQKHFRRRTSMSGLLVYWLPEPFLLQMFRGATAKVFTSGLNVLRCLARAGYARHPNTYIDGAFG